MKFGAMKPADAVGGVTVHSIRQNGLVLKKGTLIGEEIYAAEAYLARSPAPLARLLTQDTLRTVIIIAIILLMFLAAVGLQISL